MAVRSSRSTWRVPLRVYRLLCVAFLAAIVLILPSQASAQLLDLSLLGLPLNGDPVAQVLGPNTYIVVLKPTALSDVLLGPSSSILDIARPLVALVGGILGLVFNTVLQGFTVQLPLGVDLSPLLQLLRVDPRVLYVEKDQVCSVYQTPQTQARPTGISRVGGYTAPFKAIYGCTDNLCPYVDADVAVFDSGIDRDHPDLNVVGSIDCTTGAGCVTYLGSDDDNGHGTHVAGTIGALNNGIGVVGVAPGVRLWAVKVLDKNLNGWYSNIIAALDWTVSNKVAGVINLSMAGKDSSALKEAIANTIAKGVVVVAAAGNDFVNAATVSPANAPDAITVSAIADFNGKPGGLGAATCTNDQDDTNADFSNFGAVINMAAPGVCIQSTWPTDISPYNVATISGTSQAAPHVAGAAALLTSNNRPVDRNGVLALRAQLQTAGTKDWLDLSRDGTTEPLLGLAKLPNPKTAPAIVFTAVTSGSDPGEGSVNVTWTVASSAPVASFAVLRSFALVGSTASPTLWLVDDDLIAGVTYTYQVCAPANPPYASCSAAARITA